ncbi:MAG TPA: glycosyltransferase family 2 protein, partial [Candidatus Ozemobacteraceae bacterium]|nr:glycosyltransferase family 2 protein [Candidatus Ozemobacteraceae bacterium]
MNDASIKISVYIASHNYGKYLQEAINSVLRQSIGGWELILINDNSFDNTQEIMELYRGDPRVSILTTNGIGLPAVANLALKVAKGEYLIRLDADDVFDENILLVLSNKLDRDPDVALVFPDYFLVDETGGFIIYEGRGALHKSNHMFDMPANGACTMIRRSVLEKLGGYREDLGAQDGLDLWLKVIKEYKCANINLPLFYYRRHGD